jgi:V/A-type H+-transporting ATPase subunit I
MFRPERMASASIICLRKDQDRALEALDCFGSFHVEENKDNLALDEQRELIQVAEEAISNVNSVVRQLELEKSGPLDLFRSVEIEKTQLVSEDWQSLETSVSKEISELKDQTDRLTTSQKGFQEKKTELQGLKAMAETLSAMQMDIIFFEKMQRIYLAIVKVPRKNVVEMERDLSSFPIILQHCLLTKDAEFLSIALPRKHADEADKILKLHHADIISIPRDMPRDLHLAQVKIKQEISEIEQKEQEISNALEELGEAKKNRLFALRETAQNILNSLNAKGKFLQTERLVTVTGFVAKRELSDMRAKIETQLAGNVLVLENELKPEEKPPSVLRNHPIIKPFEELTKLYGLPHYDELDPTPILAISFPLIFGLMFGDLGHGLVLLGGGLALALLIKGQGTLKNFSWILVACGIGSVIAGLLFGEFFGKPILHPLWFDPFAKVPQFLIFSLFVGITQIMTGLLLEIANFAIKRDILDAVAVSLPKVAFYSGSVYMFLAYGLNFGAWFRGPILFSVIPFIFMVSGKTIALQILKKSGHPVHHVGKQESAAESFFEGSDLVTRFLSNTMSYTRILALLMAHWALLLATYAIAGIVSSSSLTGAVIGGVIILGGNVFVIGFETLIVFIQALRLHFYEWFSKFFGGNGAPFIPFKYGHVYSNVVLRRKPDVS